MPGGLGGYVIWVWVLGCCLVGWYELCWFVDVGLNVCGFTGILSFVCEFCGLF